MNLNKVLLIGRLTQNPEMRSTPSGQNVTSFSVATSRVWYDQNKQKKQASEFHNIVAWGKLAEIISQYMIKGSLIYIEGRLQTRSWEDQAGVKRYRTEIIAENIQMGPKNSGGANISSGDSEPAYASEAMSTKTNTTQAENGEEEIKVEDIPF